MPDYAAHEAVYFSQAITADDFAMKKNPKYVNKVVAPTLEPISSIGAFVVNNINVTNQEINDKIIGVIAIGPIVKGPQGAECVRWNTKEKKWESKWTRSDVSSVSMIPAVSIKSEMVFVCGWNDASGWEVTGLDWKSGATRHRSILGKNNRANGAYAIIQYLANGDLLFNSVAGPIRVKY